MSHMYSQPKHKKRSIGTRVTKIVMKAIELAFFIGFVFTGAFALFNLGATALAGTPNILNPALMYSAGSFLIAWGVFSIPSDVLEFVIDAREASNDKVSLTREQRMIIIAELKKELAK